MRKVDFDLVSIFEGRGAEEGEFATGSEGDPDSYILVPRSMWIVGPGDENMVQCQLTGFLPVSQKVMEITFMKGKDNARDHSRRIMMKWLPIRTIPIPIESRPDTFLFAFGILAQSINHHFKRWRPLRIFGDQMSPLVPADPFGSGFVFFLEGAHFFHEFVVQVPVGFGTEKFWDHNHCWVFDVVRIYVGVIFCRVKMFF